MSGALRELVDLDALRQKMDEKLGHKPGAGGAGLLEFISAKGGGKTTAALKKCRGGFWAWIEKDLDLHPEGAWQVGVKPEKLLLIDAKTDTDAFWSAQQILRSGVFQGLVLKVEERDEKELRRLQIAAERAGTNVILLRERSSVAAKKSTSANWLVSSQVEIAGNSIRILKDRSGLCKEWFAFS